MPYAQFNAAGEVTGLFTVAQPHLNPPAVTLVPDRPSEYHIWVAGAWVKDPAATTREAEEAAAKLETDALRLLVNDIKNAVGTTEQRLRRLERFCVHYARTLIR